jgi:ubiquinol-cytochrome c reductase iron-sulfur subunit
VTDNSANVGRRRFLVGSTSAVGAVGVVGAAVPFVGFLEPQREGSCGWRPGPHRHQPFE